MSGDTLLLIILSVGTFLLNKDYIFSEWSSVKEESEEQL